MITNFGKFQVNEKQPRKGRNPATLKENMAELKFEQQSEVLVPYILENHEGFEKDEEMDILFQGEKATLEPVFDWVKNRIGRKFEDARP